MRKLAIIVLLASLFAFGCSGGSVVTPYTDSGDAIGVTTESNSSHNLWGLWQFTADPDAGTLDYVQLRTGEMHLNALPFLEPPMGVNLTVESLHLSGANLDVTIGLRHPFTGLDQFTGFDVCGIFISHGSVSSFEDSDIVLTGETDTRMLNADGGTRWWNPAEFPVNPGNIKGYTDGLYGTPDSVADFNCTVNGYKYYCDELGAEDSILSIDPIGRGVFSAGVKNVRTYKIRLDSGLVFNYAVDACWRYPTGSKPWNVPDDFPQGANRPEAWAVSITELTNTLYNDGVSSGGDLALRIDVYDWFDADLNTVKVESPMNFPSVTSLTPVGGGDGFATYLVEIFGVTPPQYEINLLITVTCEASGYGGLLPGKDISAYFRYNTQVSISPPMPAGWARSWGGTFDRSFGVAADPDGNSYTVGYFESFDTVDFDPGDGEDLRSSNGGQDICVSKFDTYGNFCWARTWGGSSDDEAQSVCVGFDGSIYIAGSFRGAVDFDTGSGVDTHTASGGEDSFLSKFDPDGNFIWARSWGGADSHYSGSHYQSHPYFGDCAFGVDVDESGNIYVAGCGFDGVGFSYVRKYTPDGIDQWERKWGDSDFDKAFDVAVFGADEIYVVGRFDGIVDFDPGTGTVNLTAHDAHDSYLAKYNAAGEFQWARGWGGTDKYTGYSDPTTYYSDGAYGVDVDTSGKIFVVGEFYGTTDFDPGPGTTSHTALDTYGYGDAYMTVFNQVGEFQWVRVWGGEHFQKAYGIGIGASGTIYVAGRFYNTVDFDTSGGVEEHTSSGDCDIYLSKFDTSGNWYWVRCYGGTSYDIGMSAAIDADDNAYMAGFFDSTVDFDPGPDVDNHTNSYGEDIFVTKLLPNGFWEP